MINQFIDHTILKNITSDHDVERLCQQAITYQFKAVCVPPTFVKLAKKLLQNTNVQLATVVGFPFGYHNIATKVFEAQQGVKEGAGEIDLVINLNKLKSGDKQYLIEEINQVKRGINNQILKVIVETSELTPAQKQLAITVVNQSSADYIKTSTGFSSAGANLADVIFFKKMARQGLKIKASGGIASFKQAEAFIKAGADRIGTSQGEKIMQEFFSYQKTARKGFGLKNN